MLPTTRNRKRVTVVEMLDTVATDVHSIIHIGLLRELHNHRVNILTGVRISAITGGGTRDIDKKVCEITVKADIVTLDI